MLAKLLKSILSRTTPPAKAEVAPDTMSEGMLHAHLRSAKLALPGPHYSQVLSAVHRQSKPRTYVEVGIGTGDTIALALPGTRVLGVDIKPMIEGATGPDTRIFAMKSDDFFAQVDVAKELDGLPVDLAFIDGMHHFEFALRDFIALERLCSRDSTILVHDTYPLDRLTAARERLTLFWSGDVWRFVLALKKYRPDLALHTIAAAPTGLTLIRRLDPASRTLAERLDAIVAEFTALDYGTLDADKAAALSLVPNTPEQLRQLLQ